MSTETTTDSPARTERRCIVAHVAVGVMVAVIIGLVGAAIRLGWLALVIGLAVGAAVSAHAYFRGDEMALRAIGARRVQPGEQPRLDNVIHGLAVSYGFRTPDLYLVDDAAPNAMAVGRNPRHGAVAVTTGLLDGLRRIELEGVLAHELTRIRSREAHAGVSAATLVARPLKFAPGLASSLAARLVEPSAGLHADMAGAALTRYPPGLAAGLAVMDRDGRHIASDHPAYGHLWINVPDGSIIEQQFSIAERIEVLGEL